MPLEGLESALDNANEEALQEFSSAVRGSLDNFIDQRRKTVIRDLQKLYQEFHPGEYLPEDVWENVRKELKSRLEKIPRSRFLPKVNRGKIEFVPFDTEEGEDKGWASTWGQALRLLSSIAEYPRRAITDPYYLRGIRVDLDDLLKAMDVCEDAIISAWLSRNRDTLGVERRALEELHKLRAIIADQDIGGRQKTSRFFC